MAKINQRSLDRVSHERDYWSVDRILSQFTGLVPLQLSFYLVMTRALFNRKHREVFRPSPMFKVSHTPIFCYQHLYYQGQYLLQSFDTRTSMCHVHFSNFSHFAVFIFQLILCRFLPTRLGCLNNCWGSLPSSSLLPGARFMIRNHHVGYVSMWRSRDDYVLNTSRHPGKPGRKQDGSSISLRLRLTTNR